MEFDEISLVTRPANQLSKVVLFKSDTTIGDEMSETEVTEAEVEATEAEATADEADVEKAGYKSKKMMGRPMPDMEEDEEEEMPMGKGKGKKMKKDDDTIDLPSEVYEYIESLEAANAEMIEQLEKAAAEEEAKAQDILKSADPQIVAIVKAAEERAEAAERIAKAERDFRLEREFIGKAAEMVNLPIEAEAFGKVLKAAAEALDTEVFDALMSVLTAANEGIGSGNLFAEVGKSGSFENDGATSEINKAAARLIEANPSLTREQAVAKAVESDPTLYNAYLRGN